MQKIVTLFVFLVVTGISMAQKTSSIDSLHAALKLAKEDTAKVSLYSKISQYYIAHSIDSAPQFINDGVQLAQKTKYRYGQIELLNLLGNYHEHKANYEEALFAYDQALNIAKEDNSTRGFAILYNNIGMVHIRQGKYETALPLMFEALKAEEKLKNNVGIAQAYNNIGVIYFYQQSFAKATDYFEKSVAMQELIGDPGAIRQAVNNLGAVYDYLEEHEKAITQYQKAYIINKAQDERREMATNLHNIGVSLYKLKKFSEAEKYHNESLEIREEIGDYHGIALSYFNYGELMKNSERKEQAKEYFKKSLDISEKNDLKEITQRVYKSLSEVYADENNFKLANEYLHKYIAVKDSVLNKENSRIIAETEAKYQTEKKERELLESQAVVTAQEQKIKEKNRLIFGSVIFVAVIVIIGYLLVNQQRLKNKQLRKESELKEALHQIATQNKLQEQRLHVSRELHDNIGAQLTFIISSLDNIRYALKNKNEFISGKIQGISSFTSNTINELRDTIWAMNKTDILLEDLQTRIGTYLSNARVLADNIEFDFSENLQNGKEYRFSSLEGINLYRIIQEAINNSLKYAQATRIGVSVSEKNGNLLISITDNGKGFDMALAELGNGLGNMQRRAEEANATYAIYSQPGNGTTITITYRGKKHESAFPK